jgi:propionyl-CoA synthetase
LNAELVTLVREQVGAFAYYRETRVVERLPKTRSGKVLRSTMRSIAAGRDYAVPSTIDDPAALAEIEAALGRPARAPSS